ncbi:MAG: radical SAM protein, partial [Eubacteriales bacterium]|nr:radical SAM protein [Eubacteriales bacterium]
MTETTENTFRIGPIRPPSEANSLLIQITKGCTWNKCKFCALYKNSTFQAYTVESIKKDIDVIDYYAQLVWKYINNEGVIDRAGISRVIQSLTENEQNSFYMVYNWIMHGCESVFLQDGNSLALKPERVVEVLLYLRSKFPNIKRITTYARAETLSKITAEEFKALRAAGLDRIHSGFESGS